MRKIIIMGLTLFTFALISGCGWFTGDGDGDGTTDGGTTAGEATAGTATGDGPEEAEECGALASAIEAIAVAEISCSRLIPTEHKRTASYYFVIGEDITEEEQQAAVEACGYANKFVEDIGDSDCKSGNSASRLCYNKSVKWMEDLKSQGYSCQRAEAVSYNLVLEQQGYKKVNDKYVKE